MRGKIVILRIDKHFTVKYSINMKEIVTNLW